MVAGILTKSLNRYTTEAPRKSAGTPSHGSQRKLQALPTTSHTRSPIVSSIVEARTRQVAHAKRARILRDGADPEDSTGATFNDSAALTESEEHVELER